MWTPGPLLLNAETYLLAFMLCSPAAQEPFVFESGHSRVAFFTLGPALMITDLLTLQIDGSFYPSCWQPVC